MVPSLTAVNRQGVPAAARPALRRPRGPRRAARLARRHGPAAGHHARRRGLPALGVGRRSPTPAATGPARPWPPTPSPGLPAIDTGVTAVARVAPHARARGTPTCSASLGVSEAQMPIVVPMGQAAGTLPGSDTVITGGTIDALCDQIVSGATEPGDVLVIFGATLIVLGGVRRVARGARADQLPAHDAGAVPHRRPEQRRRPLRRLGPPAAARHAPPGSRPRAARAPARATRIGCRSGCPTSAASARPSRTTRCARTSTGSTSARAPRRSSGPPTRRAGSWSGACSTGAGVKADADRGQRRRLAGDGVDGRGGRRHQPARRHRRRARGRGPRRGLLRPHGRRARDVARRLGALGRPSGAGSSRTRPGCAPPTARYERFSELGHRAP